MTKEQYTEAVERIARLNPGELLLPALRKGHSAATEIYLRSALRRCPDEEPDWKAQTPYADETLRALWRERTRLFGEMNKQSNLFHACKTDEERAANSAKVLSWWDDIRAVKSKIAWYEAHGELPPVAEEDDELPDNPALVFASMNLGVVVLGALVGVAVFKERLVRINALGLLLALVAIALLAWG